MIETLLPARVIAVEAFDDPADGWLFPEEERLVSKAVDKRRREFTTGRHCARQALVRLGLPAAPLVSGPRGEPIWPAGVVGSITHCAGYRAAAVARDRDAAALGIDAEPAVPLPAGVLGTIALPEEISHLADLSRHRPTVRWDRLLFSAKESVYKVWFPINRRCLGFEQASIAFDPDTGTFAARILAESVTLPDGRDPRRLDGHWLTDRGLVLTAITVAPSEPG